MAHPTRPVPHGSAGGIGSRNRFKPEYAVVFNFEGGCYAECINLSLEREPTTWDAVHFGAIMENVALGDHGRPLYDAAALTENTRAAYPWTHLSQFVSENRAGDPGAVVFLTGEIFGMLLPVAVLSREQATYHFLGRYTALVGHGGGSFRSGCGQGYGSRERPIRRSSPLPRS